MRVEISSDINCSCGYSVRRSANRKPGHLLGGQAYYSIMSICFLSRGSYPLQKGGKSRGS